MVQWDRIESSDMILYRIMVYSCNGILFNHKKGLNTDMCCKTDEPPKPQVKYRKLDTKWQILYDSINMKSLELRIS